MALVLWSFFTSVIIRICSPRCTGRFSAWKHNHIEGTEKASQWHHNRETHNLRLSPYGEFANRVDDEKLLHALKRTLELESSFGSFCLLIARANETTQRGVEGTREHLRRPFLLPSAYSFLLCHDLVTWLQFDYGSFAYETSPFYCEANNRSAYLDDANYYIHSSVRLFTVFRNHLMGV